MTDSYVRLDSAAINEFFRSEQGPVGRHTSEVAQRVKTGAQSRVGVSVGGHGIGASGAEQHLRDALVTRPATDEKGFAVLVGAELPHAQLHHTGTKPHVIRPRNKTFLKFPTTPGGSTFVFAREVNHPGTAPNPYLVEAARAEGLDVRELAG